MSDLPGVSVALGTYNGERFLQEQLDSLAGQRVRPVELVACDDDSSDETMEILERFAENAPFPVRIFRNESNVGFTANLIGAAERCQGPLIAFCDQDDVWHHEKLARQVAYLDAHPDIGAVMTRQEPFFEDDILAPPSWLKRDKVYGDLGGVLQLSALIRREAFALVGGFAESRGGADDLDWFLRARRKEIGIEMLPDILVRRRIHARNASYDTEKLRRGLMDSLHALSREREEDT
jgi:glycosyltransferase involved in cell wall biosynthesis